MNAPAPGQVALFEGLPVEIGGLTRAEQIDLNHVVIREKKLPQFRLPEQRCPASQFEFPASRMGC